MERVLVGGGTKRCGRGWAGVGGSTKRWGRGVIVGEGSNLWRSVCVEQGSPVDSP
jgi:hypothetical protein